MRSLVVIRGAEDMSCEWGYTDCQNQNNKCHLCFTEGQFYTAPKAKMPKRAKQTKRAGSLFEAKNSNQNNAILLGCSTPTPNSGAGVIKGDEKIKGLVRITEELKEQNSTTSKGKKTFTIHKEWLEKLRRESLAENQEFWYLKFVFGQEDVKNTNDYYVILENDILMSIVKTLWEDRKTAKQAQNQIDIANKRKEFIEAENAMLHAEIELLKAQLKAYKQNDET